MSQPNYIKLVYEEGESGWAEDLGDGKARIANLPLAENLNIGDVVKVVEKNGRRHAGDLVVRAFNQKTGIRYPEPHKETWATLVKAFDGCKLEGMVPGMGFIAHNGTADDVRTKAKAAGIELLDASDLL